MELWFEKRAYSIMKETSFEFLIEYPHVITNIASIFVSQTYERLDEAEEMMKKKHRGRHIFASAPFLCFKNKSFMDRIQGFGLQKRNPGRLNQI